MMKEPPRTSAATGVALRFACPSLLALVLLSACGRQDTPPAKQQGAGPETAAKIEADDKQFLTVITDPAELGKARQLAAAAESKPLSVERLAGLGIPSLNCLPQDMPRDQITARLSEVADDTGAEVRARANAACLLLLVDQDKGQSALLKLLRGCGKKDKMTVLLFLSFTDRTQSLSNPDLIAELLSLMTDPECGTETIRTCGILGVPGTLAALWEVLPKAEGKAKAEVLFWLVSLDPSQKSLDACAAALPGLPAQANDAHDRVLTALTRFFGHADVALEQKAAELLASDLLDMITSRPARGTSDLPQSTCGEALRFGSGPKARELTQAVLKNSKDPFLLREAYTAMRRREGAAARKRILQDLKKPAEFPAALQAVHALYQQSGDKPLVEGLYREAGARQEPGERLLLARALLAVGGGAVSNEIHTLTQGMPQARAQFLLRALDATSPKDLAQRLAAAGLITNSGLDGLVAAKVREVEEDYGKEGKVGVIELLEAAGLLLTFDTETDELPVRHDKLLQSFAGVSRGAFRPEACRETMLRKGDDDEDPPYEVQFIHSNRLYRFEARNFGDWYDVERTTASCNKALADSAAPQRFFLLDSDGQMSLLICVAPEQAAVLGEQFHVTFAAAPGDAMRQGKEFEEEAIKRLKVGPEDQ